MKEAQPEKDHRKPCSVCNTPRDVLIRCQIDASGTWHFVCTGACWTKVSGGVVDGDGAAGHAHYKYGGMWKNKHEGASARMPRRVKEKQKVRGKGNQQSAEEEEVASRHQSPHSLQTDEAVSDIGIS